jgi:hypothetical protein
MAGDVIERVARAIAKTRGVENDWPFWLEEARAAVEETHNYLRDSGSDLEDQRAAGHL